jgi:hypothetical protein
VLENRCSDIDAITLWQTFFAITHVLALLVALIHTVTLALAEDQSRQNKSEESCE